ncbi:unnamed protein product [Clonostachys byssicola]|uniref:Uncharacterized protein n=1 Tax=Clonostachys byssicola TaxID=160290 RepID=A0A9N9XY35_9HYPO|nr:unnamed protein product [Clonostachys byssicola]
MEIPMGEDPLHNICYLAFECLEFFGKIWHDFHKSLASWSQTLEAPSPEEKLNFPFRFRSYNFTSTMRDFNFWIEITGLHSHKQGSLDFKTEGTLGLSKEIISCLEMISRALKSVYHHHDKALLVPTIEFIRIFMETTASVHRAVDKLYDLGDEFRIQCVVTEKKKLGPNKKAWGFEGRVIVSCLMIEHRVRRFGLLPSDSQGPGMAKLLRRSYIEQICSLWDGR